MKLSDAILLGSVVKPQGFGGGSSFSDRPDICAFGAANLALGQSGVESLAKVYPWLLEWSNCPECGARSGIIYIVSDHLNDKHRWTRERIAIEFVRPLEAIYDNQQSSVDGAGHSAAASSPSRVVPSGEDSGQISDVEVCA